MGRTGIARLLTAVVVLHEKPPLQNPTGFKRREYVTNGKLRRVLGLGMVSFLTVSALSGCVASGNGGEPSPSMGPSASTESIQSDKTTGSDLKIPDGTLDDLSRAVNGDHKSKPVELNSMRVASDIARVFPIQGPRLERKPSDHYKLTVPLQATVSL